MKLRAVLLLAACTALFAAPVQARAGEVRVSFANGRVTIIAENATLPDILNEWSRVGGSTFVNVDKITPSELLTLRIENETELRAIDILLRSTAGYVVGPQARTSTSVSAVTRVLIMPGRRPQEYPAPLVSAAPAPVANPELQQFLAARPPKPDDDGAVARQTPPAAPAAQPGPVGSSSPLDNTRTQSGPTRGMTTSSRPGVMIGGQSRPGVPRPTPTQPKPGGGGG